MSTSGADQLAEVLDRVRTWSPKSRIALARRILETLEPGASIAEPPRLKPLSEILGMLRTDAPPPSDEECRRIIEEERMRKYG
jgi:hypothetical protein